MDLEFPLTIYTGVGQVFRHVPCMPCSSEINTRNPSRYNIFSVQSRILLSAAVGIVTQFVHCRKASSFVMSTYEYEKKALENSVEVENLSEMLYFSSHRFANRILLSKYMRRKEGPRHFAQTRPRELNSNQNLFSITLSMIDLSRLGARELLRLRLCVVVRCNSLSSSRITSVLVLLYSIS